MSSLASITKVSFDSRYRRYMVILTLSGTAQSASIPVISLYATKVLGLSRSDVGFLWMSIAVGSAISLGVGHLSDRINFSVPFVRYAALWLAFGWTALAFAQNFIELLLVFALSVSTSSVLNSQIFAALEDVMTASEEPRRAFVTSTLRTGYSVGYIVGPVVGAVLIDAVSFRAVFFVTATSFFVIAIMSSNVRRQPYRKPETAKSDDAATVRKSSRTALLIACGCVTLVLIGDFIKDSFLSIYVVDQLHKPLGIYSGTISVGAGLELLAFPLFGALADRHGSRPVIAVGLFLAIGDYGLLALAPTVWSVFASQLLHVAVVAIVYGVAVAYVQSLIVGKTGIATASYFASISMAQISAGAIGAAFVTTLGVRGLFWIPTVAAAVAFCLFTITSIAFSGIRLQGALARVRGQVARQGTASSSQPEL